MKKCSQCKEYKAFSCFTKHKNKSDGLQTSCSECQKLYAKLRYKREKEEYQSRNIAANAKMDLFINKLKNKPCADCGVCYSPWIMDFDHLDPKTKVASVSMLKRNLNYQKILEEISKCELVCANCHRDRTYKRLQERKMLKNGVNKESRTPL